MIDKIIDKIIDNYYTKKLLEEISWCFKVRHLGYRFIFDRDEVRIEIKKNKYATRYYEPIIHIQKDEALKYLFNYDKFRKSLVKIIEDYLNSNKE